jgi:hypothetical protein
MKNAHERFGFAEFEKRLKDTTTRIRLTADCFIGEPADRNVPSQGHLLSVFGTDVEVAALWAAVLGEERLRVGGPELKPHMVQFGERPSVYRGTLTLPGRRRPIRHMVVASTQLRAEGDQARIIVKGNSPDLVLRAAANFHGLPLLPEWSDWFCQRLHKAGRIRPLSGLNCAPVAIRGSKSEFLEWIGTGLKHSQIQIPPT